MAEYEYRAVPLAPGADRNATREVLMLHAEYGDWELVRHEIWPGGRRTVTVRRRLRPGQLPPLPD